MQSDRFWRHNCSNLVAKWFPIGPLGGQNRAMGVKTVKMAPSASQGTPRCVQGWPKWIKLVARDAPMSPLGAQDGSREAQGDVRMVQRGAKGGQRSPRDQKWTGVDAPEVPKTKKCGFRNRSKTLSFFAKMNIGRLV